VSSIDRHVDMVGDNVDCVIRGGVLTAMSPLGRKIGAASWNTCATPAYLKEHQFQPGGIYRVERHRAAIGFGNQAVGGEWDMLPAGRTVG
jgi:predicted methyltransferase